MSKKIERDPVLAEMSIRVARAEMERDAALKREQEAIEQMRAAYRTSAAIASGDKEKILETLHIIGIPAQDIKDIYDIEQEWRAAGGRDEWLKLWRKEHNGKAFA